MKTVGASFRHILCYSYDLLPSSSLISVFTHPAEFLVLEAEHSSTLRVQLHFDYRQRSIGGEVSLCVPSETIKHLTHHTLAAFDNNHGQNQLQTHAIFDSSQICI